MKRLVLKFIVAILTFSLGLCGFALLHYRAHITSRTEAEATNRTYEFYEAIERHDREALNNIIADDCTFTFNRNFLVDDKPVIFGKVDAITALTAPRYIYSMSVVNTTTREDKTKVTVSGDLLLRGEQASINISYHFNNTYTNRQGRSQLVSAELTQQDWPKAWPARQR